MALIVGSSQILLTVGTVPWTLETVRGDGHRPKGRKTYTLITPGGRPALSHSSAMIMVAPGSLSEGFTIRVFPGMFVSFCNCQSSCQPTSDGSKCCRPEDYHGREVERGYGSRNPQGKPSNIGVHVIGNLKLVSK